MNNEQLYKDFFENTPKSEAHDYLLFNMAFATEVAKHLRSKNISRKDFAKAIGIKESLLSKWLTGVHNLTLKSIFKIQKALDQPFVYVLQRSEIKEFDLISLNHFVPTVKQSPIAEFLMKRFLRSKPDISMHNIHIPTRDQFVTVDEIKSSPETSNSPFLA